MVSGKKNRLARITRNGKMLCVPIDHGVTNGPIQGLEQPWRTISAIRKGGASAVLAHKGVFKSLPEPAMIGTIMHLNASTVREAIRLGVDAVSIHINIGADEEPEMLEDLGFVADECDEWEIPFIAMMYPRGPRIKDLNVETVSHAARIGAELGADIVKTVYTQNPEDFRQVVERCTVPVVLAGGAKLGSDLEVLRLAQSAIRAGAMGITFGRNIFSHVNPEGITRALAQVVFEDASPESAVKLV
jgi:fructose-bisphosphate aldolase/2-amino-3,7-dideoxy-D-threo-hept-6-ulosonate synthase